MNHDRIRRMLGGESEGTSNVLEAPATDGGEDIENFERKYRKFLEDYDRAVRELESTRKNRREPGRTLSTRDLLSISVLAMDELIERAEEAEERRVISEKEEATADMVGDMKELQQEYEQLLEEHRDITGELRSRNDRLEDRLDSIESSYRRDLRNFSDHYLQSARDRLLAGAALIGGGLYSAAAYPFEGGILDFYASAPDAYASHPEMAVLTLGLPAVGAYSIKTALDSFSDYRDADRRANKVGEDDI